ncbi:MAG: HXXEE domain-containing protein [Candidatus Azobacteroides sp.]|nr:HXXEE domain-containing protein [Candidatus Azobacteroides sp.]
MHPFIFIVTLLPVVFMIHDFEEIIFFKPWIQKNKNLLKKRFPKFARFFIPKFEEISVPAFTLAVFEEFLLISVGSFMAIYMDFYLIWLAMLGGFSIHLIIHLVQWIAIRMYIPALITTFLSIPYCLYTYKYIISQMVFSSAEIFLCTLLGGIGLVLNTFFIHKLAGYFDKKYIRKIDTRRIDS